MATGVGFGFDTDFLKTLAKADAALNDLMDKNNLLSKSAITAYKQMSEKGVIPYVQSLEKELSILNELQRVITDSSGRAKRDFGEMKSSIVSATDSINKMLDALYKVQGANSGLGIKIGSIRESREMETTVGIRTGGKTWGVSAEDVIKEHQARLEAFRKYRSEMISMYESMFDEIDRKEKRKTAETKKAADEVSNYERKQYEDSLNRYKRQKDEQARVDKHYHDKRQRELEEVFRKEEQLIAQQSRNRADRYAYTQRFGDTSGQAIAAYNRLYDKNGLRSIQQMQSVLSKLQQAQQKLNLNTEEGKKKYSELDAKIKQVQKSIDNATGASNRFKNSQKGILDITGQLGRQLATVFSVQQLVNYAQKVVDIRKEFELQHKSLQIIIQDQDQANKLWQQTVDLALKSPFRVKELIKYTKQLAAYRIETGKLHETTKMLADVSAGLGVDMQRLILAYGQVRAAEFLRGTELRQFTEAGVPMLDELAKYFSELEKTEVTTAEVFERISKRMVSFGDVENVINRMTSSGGVFYKMQEQQAETLHGMISNFYDSLDLMMNKIGQDNDGILKGVIKTAQEITRNYEDILDVLSMWAKILSPIAASTLLVKVANSKLATSILSVANNTKIGFSATVLYEKALSNIAQKSKFASSSLRFLTKALGGLGVIAAAAAITFLIKKISDLYLEATKMDRLANRLEKSLGKIFTEDTSNLDKNIKQFDNLIERLKIANEGSQERRDIMNKMNSQYGQYLDFIVDEKTSIDDLNNSYENVILRMKERASLSTYERGVEAIEENYGDALTGAVEEFYNLFESGNVFSRNKTDFMLGAGIIPTENEIDDIYSIVQQKINELEASAIDTSEEQRDLIQNILREYYDSSEIVYGIGNKTLSVIDILVEKKKKEADLQKQIDSQYKSTLKSRKANLELARIENEYAIEQNKIKNEENLSNFEVSKKLQEAKDKFDLEKIRIEFEFGEISEKEANERRDAILNWEKGTIKSINDMIKSELGSSYTEEELSNVLINQEKKAKGINSIIKNIQDTWERYTGEIKEQVSLQSEGLLIDEDKLENAIRMEKLYRKVAEIMGVELEYTQRMSEEMRNSINELLPDEHFISIEESYKGVSGIVGDLKKKSNEYKTTIELINEAKKNGLPYNEKELRLAEESYKWAKKKLDLLDPDASTPISSERAAAINAKLEEQYQLDSIDLQESEVTLLKQATEEKEKAVAWQEQLNNMIAQGSKFSEKEIDNAAKAVEQRTLRWKLLGGVEKDDDDGGQNSLYDERIKVIDDMNKKYNELRRTLTETEAVQGSFNAYIDAFAEAYKDVSFVPKNVKEMDAEEFATKVLGFTDKDKLVDFLDDLAEEPMKTFEKIKVELAKGKYFEEMTVSQRNVQADAMTQQIEDMFGQYELSIELQKLQVPTDFAEDLFGIETKSLAEISRKIREELTSGVWGTDAVKKLKEFQRKVTEMEVKEQQERLKKYLVYTKESIGERAKIKLEELKKLEEIELTFDKEKATADLEDYERIEREKQRAILGVQKEASAEMQKLEWEQFKSSDVFIEMFNDLENVSGIALKKMIEQLEEYKDEWANLPVDQMKEVAKQLERMKSAQDERKALASPFSGGFMTAPNKEEYVRAQEQILSLSEGIRLTENSIAEIELQMQQYAEGTLKLTEDEYKNLKERLKGRKEDLSNVLTLLGVQQNIVKEYDLQLKKLKAQEDAIDDIMGMANDLYDAFVGLSEALGADSDSPAMIFAEMGMSMADTVSQTLMLQTQLIAARGAATGFGLAMNTAMGVVGWIVMGVQLLTQAISAIVEAHDNNIQKQIEAEQKYVDDLAKKYDNLAKSIDNAYNIHQLENYAAQSRYLSESIIDSYERMIALEKAKKQTDEEKLEEYYDAIAEEQEKLAERQKELFNEVTEGVLDSPKDAASDWVDAWLESFAEVGDGMVGLEENFEEMIATIIKKQMALSVISPYLERWKQQLENYINAESGDLTFSLDDANKFKKLIESDLPMMNESMENWYNAWGGVANLLGDAGGELSGLTKGIQGITETQAEEISAYLNSLRYYVASNNQSITELAQKILSNDDTVNPMLSQLRIIATQTTAINDLLGSLTKSGHSMGGVGMKVFIN